MPPKITDFMTRKVITVTPQTGIRRAFFTMKQHGIRHLPVVDGAGSLVGIISDRELRRPQWVDEAHDIAHVYYLDDEMAVGDVMITQVHVLHTYDSLLKGVRLLLDHNIGAAPVLDKPGRVVGVLSAVDLLGALGEILEKQRASKNKG